MSARIPNALTHPPLGTAAMQYSLWFVSTVLIEAKVDQFMLQRQKVSDAPHVSLNRWNLHFFNPCFFFFFFIKVRSYYGKGFWAFADVVASWKTTMELKMFHEKMSWGGFLSCAHLHQTSSHQFYVLIVFLLAVCDFWCTPSPRQMLFWGKYSLPCLQMPTYICLSLFKVHYSSRVLGITAFLKDSGLCSWITFFSKRKSHLLLYISDDIFLTSLSVYSCLLFYCSPLWPCIIVL